MSINYLPFYKKKWKNLELKGNLSHNIKVLTLSLLISDSVQLLRNILELLDEQVELCGISLYKFISL